jgi:2-keto-3-deoxy-L-rhamnonate aldolase RhmA
MKLSWQQIADPTITELLCNNSLDGIVLDTEHGCFNSETLYRCIQVATLCGKKCFVRLISPNKKVIRSCLDAGCDGLIFAMIENLDQVESIEQYSKYPKYGGKRGLGLVRQNRWGLKDSLLTKPPILIAQIETSTGISNLNFIKDKNTFDYYMIGPYDLTASLGIPGKFDDEKYLSCLNKAISIVGEEKMAVHIPSNVKKELKKYRNYGIIALGMDTTFLIEKYQEVEKYA